MPSIPPSAYQVTTLSRVKRPTTTQQVSRFKQTTPFRAAPPPPPSVTTQPVSRFKQTTPFKAAPPAAGAAVGGLSVGAIASALAIAIAFVLFFDEPLSKDQANVRKLQPPEPPKELEPPVPPPFRGGQGAGVLYRITYVNYTEIKQVFGPNSITVYGPIEKILQTYYPPDRYGFIKNVTEVFHKNFQGNQDISTIFAWSYYPAEGRTTPYTVITEIVRADGQPDTGGDLPPVSGGSYSPPGNGLGAPSAAPPSAAPSPLPGAPGISGAPGGSPSGAPGGSPSGEPGGSPSGEPGGSPSGEPGGSPSGEPGGSPKRFPGGLPGGFPSPAPAPNPGPTPQPNKYPGPVPSPSPNPSPNGSPGPSPGAGVGPAPSPTPTPNGAPRIGPSPYVSPPPVDPTKYPDTGFQPLIFQPNPLTENPLTPTKFTPNPKTGDPEPKKAPPLTSPPKSPAPTPTLTDDLGKKISDSLGPITILLAGITALVHPDALKSAANAGSCQSFAPGGCNAPIANNAAAAAANSANNNKLLAQILAFLQALQAAFMVPILAGVNLINTKLGPVMSGLNGIGGFLARTAEAAKIDKVLNAMNTVLLLHNAAMLSRNLGSTLGDLTSQALATIGIKDGDSPIDVNEILGKQANSFMASLLGAEVWAGTKTSWNKASSIIASATNLMYTVRSMFDSTREILEWTAENTGKIGNSLKRFRVVGENAFKWLPERVTVQNSFTRKLDRFREGVDDLDDTASSFSGVLGEVQSIQQEYADLQEQKQKFETNIKDLTPKTREENKPVTDAVTAAKTASAAPTGTENVFRGEGEKLDV